MVVSLGDYAHMTGIDSYSDDDARSARFVLEECPLSKVVAGLVCKHLGLAPIGLVFVGLSLALEDQVEAVPYFSLLDDGLILRVVISPKCISDLRPLVRVHQLEYGD